MVIVGGCQYKKMSDVSPNGFIRNVSVNVSHIPDEAVWRNVGHFLGPMVQAVLSDQPTHFEGYARLSMIITVDNLFYKWQRLHLAQTEQ